VFNALSLASRPELLLLGRQLASAVFFELIPYCMAVDSDPKIGRARGRLAPAVRRVPAVRDLAPFGPLQRQPTRELALLLSLVSFTLWRSFGQTFGRVVPHA